MTGRWVAWGAGVYLGSEEGALVNEQTYLLKAYSPLLLRSPRFHRHLRLLQPLLMAIDHPQLSRILDVMELEWEGERRSVFVMEHRPARSLFPHEGEVDAPLSQRLHWCLQLSRLYLFLAGSFVQPSGVSMALYDILPESEWIKVSDGSLFAGDWFRMGPQEGLPLSFLHAGSPLEQRDLKQEGDPSVPRRLVRSSGLFRLACLCYRLLYQRTLQLPLGMDKGLSETEAYDSCDPSLFRALADLLARCHLEALESLEQALAKQVAAPPLAQGSLGWLREEVYRGAFVSVGEWCQDKGFSDEATSNYIWSHWSAPLEAFLRDAVALPAAAEMLLIAIPGSTPLLCAVATDQSMSIRSRCAALRVLGQKRKVQADPDTFALFFELEACMDSLPQPMAYYLIEALYQERRPALLSGHSSISIHLLRRPWLRRRLLAKEALYLTDQDVDREGILPANSDWTKLSWLSPDLVRVESLQGELFCEGVHVKECWLARGDGHVAEVGGQSLCFGPEALCINGEHTQAEGEPERLLGFWDADFVTSAPSPRYPDDHCLEAAGGLSLGLEDVASLDDVLIPPGFVPNQTHDEEPKRGRPSLWRRLRRRLLGKDD